MLVVQGGVQLSELSSGDEDDDPLDVLLQAMEVVDGKITKLNQA